jgi:hypothetical protein
MVLSPSAYALSLLVPVLAAAVLAPLAVGPFTRLLGDPVVSAVVDVRRWMSACPSMPVIARIARSGAYLVQVPAQMSRLDLKMCLLVKVKEHADVRRLAELD